MFRRGDELVNRFQIVEDHQEAFGVKRLGGVIGVIGVIRSSLWAWLTDVPR